MGGGGGGFLTSRGTSNVLTRTTAILAAAFFATSLMLSILAGIDRKPRSILQDPNAPAAPTSQPATPGGAAGAPGGLLDRLQRWRCPSRRGRSAEWPRKVSTGEAGESGLVPLLEKHTDSANRRAGARG